MPWVFGENNGEIVVRTAKLMCKTAMIQAFWRVLAGLSIVHISFWEGFFANKSWLRCLLALLASCSLNVPLFVIDCHVPSLLVSVLACASSQA